MATFKSVQLNATAIAPNLPTDVGGRLRVDYAKYTLAGTEVATDVIELWKLPLGARVHAIRLDNTDFGLTVTADLGDAASATRYAAAYALGTAGVLDYGLDLAAQGQVSVLIDAENKRVIKLTLTTVTTPTAGAVIDGRIEYVID